MSGWGKPVQQGWGGQGQQQTGQQGWGQQGQQTGQQGWGQQGQQTGQQTGQQGWGGQGQQTSGWGQQGQKPGWGGQGQQTGQQGWGTGQQTGQQGWGGQQTGQQTGQQGWGQQGQQTGQQGWGGQQTGQQNQGWGTGQQTGQTTSIFDPNRDYIIATFLDDDKDKVLDVSQGTDQSRNQLILYHKNGNKNQRFRFVPLGNGKYRITNGAGGVLLVPLGNNPNPQLIAGQSNNSSDLFEIEPSKFGVGTFVIKTYCGKSLDVCEQKTSKGTPILQYPANGQKNQAWYIYPA